MIELTDPSEDMMALAWNAVAGFLLDAQILNRAYVAMSSWPKGSLQVGQVKGYTIRISWEWISGKQKVKIEKVIVGPEDIR